MRVGVLIAFGLTVAGVTSASAATPGALKTVRYRGYAMRVPRSWPVFRLASDPSTCVRFNRHAVYLGRPGSQQLCPPHAVGRTEAILVEPLTARSGAGARAAAVRAASVTAAPAGAAAAVHPDAVKAAGASTAPFHSDATDVGGLGFDTCSAPSPATMAAWLTYSPFRAAAVYIGGANSACAQPNLSASWVAAESAAGWQLIPVYVGLQAPGSDCGCSEIVAAQAAAEGTAAAVDAVTQAQALGIDSGNPIYDDMEAYSPSSSNTATVLAFLDAWTTELHAYGYVAGVYGSGTSGVTDLVNAQGTDTPTGAPFVEPDDLWIADWNGEATVTDPYVPAPYWADNQRLHQFEGGHVDDYGGQKLDIDSDYLDGATATAGVGTAAPVALPDGTFVSYEGKTYRLAGGAPLYVHSWKPFGAQQPTVTLTQAEWQALNPEPANGTFIRATGTGKVYRIAGGAPIPVPSWAPFGGPQPVVVVDRWNLLYISSALSHLRSTPATGTVVEGLPSGRYWAFAAGWRAQTVASTSAVAVADAGLTPFLESPTVSRDTLSGVGKRDPTLRVVLTAGANAPSLKSFVLALPQGLSFSGSTAALAQRVVVWWGADGKPLQTSARLSHGKLTITLAVPARKVLITVASPALAATKALAAQVRTGATSPLAVILDAVDTQRQGDVLTLSPRTTS
jgi:hypothetical protein